MLFGMLRPTTIVHARSAIVWLRVASSVAWLDSAFIGKDAKLAPAFLNGSGLSARISETFVHSALDPRIAQWLVTAVMPHAAVFAVLLAVADATAGLCLAFGLFTRVGAAIAIARALTNIAVAGGLGADTIGYNGMLIVAAVLCMWTGAGRRFGVDGALIDRYPKARALRVLA